ncbi:MAG: polysaccharide deacetylase family protein [Ferruginibacter sp.]
MQLLLYASATSARLQYICDFIFKEVMALDFSITKEASIFQKHTGITINYTNEVAGNASIKIGNYGLLFESNIRQQDIVCFEVNNYTAFFKTENGDLPFDIFSASFYLISRYEEYLPHKKDMYGRYAHENSLAFKKNFLHLPMVNIWIGELIRVINNKFPGFRFNRPHFAFIPTYDIDMAFSYRYKGWLRNAGGFIKSPSLQRIKVLAGLTMDPFDSYDWLHKLNNRHKMHPVYFFLLASKNAGYDKNIFPGKKAMWDLVRQHTEKYSVGLHPSWQSGDNRVLLQQEKEQLERMAGVQVIKSRQHYIRFDLPGSYRGLEEAGIRDDYSMGYGSINGFRASVASSFYWFDLEKNLQGQLRIHPFCFMDANSFYEENLAPAAAFNELLQYYSVCKEINGQMITVWHNNFLGTDPRFAGWKGIYEQFIELISYE